MNSLKDTLSKTVGRITFDELSDLDFSAGFEDDLPSLKEDLLQIQYPGNILLDIGWYPSFDINGSFKVQVVKDTNWEQPMWCKEAGDYNTLVWILNAAIAFANLRPGEDHDECPIK